MDTSKTKPDLMANSARPADGKRILAHLEHGPRPAVSPTRAAGWTIDGWTIGLCVLLLVMCCVAWLMHDRTITPQTFRHSYEEPARRSVTQAAARRAEASPQPAEIINVASPTEAAPAAPMARDMATEPTTAPSTTRASAAAHKPTARPTTTARPSVSTAGTPGAPVVGDTDVTLLTAIVAHANKPSTVNPERARDVVERHEGDSTAQLLARCKQLGMIEGMLCRSRICSGRWENDDACRAPAH